MQLDSARELKAKFTTTILAPLAMSVVARRALNVATQPIGDGAALHRTIAVGIAKTTQDDFRLAVRVQRRAMEQSPELDAIRRQARGEIDVRYIGRVAKRALPWHQRQNRPLRIGGSIGHVDVTAGTLGAFVRSREDAGTLILSNNHVLANENRSKAGDPIIQPGALDQGANPGDRVASLLRFVRLRRHAANRLDCAVASVGKNVKFSVRTLAGLGKLAGLGPELLDEGAPVAKVGRTTGTTRGRVTAFEMDNVIVAYDMGEVKFDNQIEIEGAEGGAFSDGGDSGSLIVDAGVQGVALLFSGSDQGGANGHGLTYANPLRQVLDELKVDLLY
jgi:hypothetical protein